MKEVKKIAIIGVGIMGQGIAILGAQRGFSVLIYDFNQNVSQKALDGIKKFFEKSLEKNKITESELKEMIGRVVAVDNIEKIKNADLVIEAIIEVADEKKKLFAVLDDICSDSTILASNTSTIPISQISQAVKNKERVIGMHFMNPAFLIELVEIVRGNETSDEILEKTIKIAYELGKTPVVVKDSPGFVLNRLLIPMINEAVFCLQEGVASKEGIDKIMKIGARFPMGPLELADLIGLDICLRIMKELEKGFSNTKYAPCPLLGKMVEQGYLGRKTKKGFYEY